MCAAITSCSVEHKIHVGELTILKRYRWARRKPGPIKSLPFLEAVATVRGDQEQLKLVTRTLNNDIK